MSKPKDQYRYPELRLMEVTEDPCYKLEYRPRPITGVMFDQWGNEWGNADDFLDLDFRTVDE